MSFKLHERKVRYSANEKRVFDLLPKNGDEITISKLTCAYYGIMEDWPYHANQVMRVFVRNLERKIEHNEEPFRLRKSKRAGPKEIKIWLEEMESTNVG